jgi:hypothetical protein
MPYHWPDDPVFTHLACDVEDRWCHTCGSQRTVCDHRQRRLFTRKGPLHVVCKLAPCPTPACPAPSQTRSPEADTALAMPWGVRGGDVGCWVGPRRFARHWSGSPIRAAWADPYTIRLADEALERSSGRDQRLVAARPPAPPRLAAADAEVDAVRRSLAGLQPEKCHAPLDVVRELTRKRVGGAAALVSRTTAEVQQGLAQARSGAARLGKPVRLGRSEKQAACVRGLAAACPGVPHRYWAQHVWRDVAQPVRAADSHAKGQRRRTGRG